MFLAEFCNDSAEVMNFLHTVLVIFRIIVPVLLIIFGMVDLGKAVVSSDEKAISKSTGALIKKLIAALFIFFLPTIISAIVNLTDEQDDAGHTIGSSKCIKCIMSGNQGDENNCTKVG